MEWNVVCGELRLFTSTSIVSAKKGTISAFEPKNELLSF